MGDALGAGLNNEVPRGRDVTVQDREIEESHTLTAGMIRYVSSAYFKRSFPSETVCKSKPFITQDASPIADP